jgi:hypothetical protein
MKRAIPALILTGLTIGTTSTVRADGPVGRYQLMPAIVEFVGDGPTIQDRVVFKIDTVTGQTWSYLSAKIKGKIVEEWTPIEQ